MTLLKVWIVCGYALIKAISPPRGCIRQIRTVNARVSDQAYALVTFGNFLPATGDTHHNQHEQWNGWRQ